MEKESTCLAAADEHQNDPSSTREGESCSDLVTWWKPDVIITRSKLTRAVSNIMQKNTEGLFKTEWLDQNSSSWRIWQYYLSFLGWKMGSIIPPFNLEMRGNIAMLAVDNYLKM